MKISKEEAVYAVLKMVVDDKISLHMITTDYGYIIY